MTDEDIIARVSNCFDHSYTLIPPRKNHWTATYKFTLHGFPAVQLMNQIYPLMGKRRQGQIDHALENYVYDPHACITGSKVTEDQIRAIKRRLAVGETAKSIAKDFPISHYAVWDIKSGKTWEHISINDEIDFIPDPVLPPLVLSDENLFHWLIGIFEGEGSFMSGPPSSPNEPRISVAMTDEDVIQRVAELCQTTYQSLRVRNENHKQVYRMIARGRKAVELMRRVQPLMGNRRQAQIENVFRHYRDIPNNKGAYNVSAKISEAQAREIKLRLQNGDSLPAIAEHFRVSISLVREIKVGRTWKHVDV